MKRLMCVIAFIAIWSVAFPTLTLEHKSTETKIISANNPECKERIKDFLITFCRNYPDAQLADVYKGFFQDCFGPQHLIKDSLTSRRYIVNEISSNTIFPGPDYEYCGIERNFVRVNLGLIADGTIPLQLFMECFLNGLCNYEKPTLDEWIEYWNVVDLCSSELQLTFSNEEADRIMINDKLNKGNPVVHHSQKYNDSYNFHYRIIPTTAFKTKIHPLLKRVESSEL